MARIVAAERSDAPGPGFLGDRSARPQTPIACVFNYGMGSVTVFEESQARLRG